MYTTVTWCTISLQLLHLHGYYNNMFTITATCMVYSSWHKGKRYLGISTFMNSRPLQQCLALLV